MRLTFLLIALTATSAAQGSWWSGSNEPAEYASWSTKELQNWLDAHNIPYPSQSPSPADLQAAVKAHWDSAFSWSADQYGKAQTAFATLKADAFDTWDESRLREFLLEQGVVNPAGPREQLVLLAKQKWRQYSSVASVYSKSASSSTSSLSSTASKQASTAMYGDSWHQASKSASSIIAQATNHVGKALDDSKDYVYSSWDDNRIRAYLEEHGVVEPPATSREKLLATMRDTYAATTNPVWQAWSDSYIHQWLVDHGIIKDEVTKRREDLVNRMQTYYYGVNERVWDTWDDSQMKAWLVSHNVIKSDVQLQREKMQKLLMDNYVHAYDTTWGSWKDSDMRQWLIEHGYLRSDAQRTRDQLVKLMQEKHGEAAAMAHNYLAWPDARLRAYLREVGVPESAIPKARDDLLQEVRVRWYQVGWRANWLWRRVKEYFDSGVEVAEDKLGMILDILSGGAEGAKTGAHGEKEQTQTTAKIEL